MVSRKNFGEKRRGRMWEIKFVIYPGKQISHVDGPREVFQQDKLDVRSARLFVSRSMQFCLFVGERGKPLHWIKLSRREMEANLKVCLFAWIAVRNLPRSRLAIPIPPAEEQTKKILREVTRRGGDLISLSPANSSRTLWWKRLPLNKFWFIYVSRVPWWVEEKRNKARTRELNFHLLASTSSLIRCHVHQLKRGNDFSCRRQSRFHPKISLARFTIINRRRQALDQLNIKTFASPSSKFSFKVLSPRGTRQARARCKNALGRARRRRNKIKILNTSDQQKSLSYVGLRQFLRPRLLARSEEEEENF